MKRIGALFLLIPFLALMTACGNCSASDTGKTAEDPASAFPANSILLDTGAWPQNEYTALLPQPESGTFLRGWIDPDQGSCYLELSDITQTESEQYVKDLKETGFTEIKTVSEKINDDSISVGTVLSKDDTFVSISYLDDLFCMRIKN